MQSRGAFETHPRRMLRIGNLLHTCRLVSVYTHTTLSLPESRKNATWTFLFGKGSLAEKKKEARPGARIPGPVFQLAAAVEDGPCPLDLTVLSTL